MPPFTELGGQPQPRWSRLYHRNLLRST
jgi:hypothetical protein